MKFALISIPFPVDGKGSKGMGTDLPKQNYEDIGNISTRARNYLYKPEGERKLCSYSAALAVFRRKMEAEADKTGSQLAEGKHNFLKKFDQNFKLFYSN